jgi:class 3 adenylate cyclase/tetratricopeptide (TPR) repeat protein
VICPACSHDAPDGSAFCNGCGAKLVLTCPSCGATPPPGSRFCNGCGTSLDAPASPKVNEKVRPPVEGRDPRAYTPKHLAEKILQSKSALEGERKRVTVMFADVKGSMELAEQLDPEAWHGILDRFFQILADGVHRFEGTVNQYTGDGIMALFGAPIAHEDHAERACYAALQIRSAVRDYANQVRVEHGVPFGVRVGLNSGEVVVGRIGDDLRMDYTAQGHSVGLAQRMEALAESGHICVSENTAQLVEGYFQLADLGRTKVKGVDAPVGLFDLEGVGQFKTRLDRSRARGLSTFVGRDKDIAVLEAALERTKTDGGQVLGVVADAGTGKSRLCAEFMEGCRAKGIQVLEARGVAHGKAIPMLPMLELWRAFYGIGEDDDPEATRAKIAGRLLMMDEGFREMLPIVFDVFGVPDPANPAPPIDAEQRQKRLHAVVKRILHDPNYGATRVFLLEDLHWFDGASDGFLQTIVESSPATRDLLLLNFRPEYQAPWMQRSYYQHLQLQPLDPEAIRDLLRDQLGEDPSVAGLPELIHEHTRGNPFFIEEVVQSLVEGGQLAGDRGAYRLTTSIDSLAVPASVQAVLAARIDRLPEAQKEVVQTAAAIGKTFPEPVLRDVMGRVSTLDEDALGEALSALAAAEFLFEASLYPQLEYSFKHPLTQEVAQGSQLSGQRVRVHAAVAEALEASEEKLEERAGEIAQHWAEAENAERAVQWYERAASWAALSDVRESLEHWRRIRKLAPRLADERERDATLLRACVEIFSAGWRMGGDDEEMEAVYREGRALAERAGDRHALARLVGFFGLVRNQRTGSADDYVRYGEEAAAIAEETGDPSLRAGIGTLPSFGHMYVGNGRKCLEWADRVLEVTGDDNRLGKEISGYSPRVSMLENRAQAYLFLGRFEEAWHWADETRRAAQESGEVEVEGWLEFVVTRIAYYSGETASGLDYARRSLEIAEKLDNESSRTLSYAALGVAHFGLGEAAEARNALQTSIAIARENLSQLAFVPESLAFLSMANLALGSREEALANTREAIGLARDGGCFYHEAISQLALATALIAGDPSGSRQEVESALGRADALVEEIELLVLAPRILETRGRFAAALGDETASRTKLREALNLDRRLGATGHARRLEEELRG